MDSQTKKITIIIAASLILIAFFIPWINAGFFGSTSAFGIISNTSKLLGKVNSNDIFEMGRHANSDGVMIFLTIVSLLIFPICSLSIIISEASDQKKTQLRFPKILLALTCIVYSIALLAKFEKEIFNVLGIGFYLTLLCSLYLSIVDEVFGVNEISSNINNTNNHKAFCTGCGNSYIIDDAGGFCEKCGVKL